MPVVQTIEGEFFGRPFEVHFPLEPGARVELCRSDSGLFDATVQVLDVTSPDSVAIQDWMATDVGKYKSLVKPIGLPKRLTGDAIHKEVIDHPLELFGFRVFIDWQPS